MKSLLAAVSFLALSAGASLAQTADGQALPQPYPMPAATPEPQDKPYPGLIRLSVDATDLDHRMYSVHESIPVQASGPMTLLYPRWRPGNHGPSNPLAELGGLIIRANGQRVEWVRDTVDVNAFHIDVPAGAKTLELDFQWLTPVQSSVGRIDMTGEIVDVQWNALALYPAGYFARDIQVEPSLRLPEGWSYGSALRAAHSDGAVVTFQTVDFDTLVDSPLYGGKYMRKIDLDPGAAVPVTLNLVADKPESLEATPEQIAIHRHLVQQAYKLYGSHHYDHYDFLLALSDRLGGIGLEHNRSSENAAAPGYFTDWKGTFTGRDLLAHEYTHSWDGKFRRPADLWTPNFNVPMRDSLLWVYEGQTQYWGYVLAARSGLWTKQQALDAIAQTAATYDNRIGRVWRAMQDTTNDPIIASRRPQSWRSWQRSEDYYSEGQLIWLDADTLIREESKGKKSLDDFARTFFGVHDGAWTPAPYTFDDVVKALNAVWPHDWATFLRTRLDGHGPGAPLDGLKRGGYRLVYTDTPTEFWKSNETRRHTLDLTYSLGMALNREGVTTEVQWDGPAFKAGLTTGAQIMAVNGVTYDMDGLKAAIKAAKGTNEPIELIVKNGDRFKVVRVEWREGLRYPHLEREGSGAARLDDILTPRK
ncbi:MAG: M61 family metallopeptidase [Proteobacteria bacterium]|nr:M61 family metallopeptidase [Pseudomonadota bacterium]